MILLTVIAAKALIPVPTWPADYHCRVVNDSVEFVEFGINLDGQVMTLDRDALNLTAHSPIKFKLGKYIRKYDGDHYARFLITSDLPQGEIYIAQSGTTAAPETEIVFDPAGTTQPPAERLGQARGYCAVSHPESPK